MLLEKINSPADIKALSEADLSRLADEIRNELVEICSRTGGHLGPNLGVVELTLALHRVFNSPADKIIWDVGHQSYVHKLLTGRRLAFTNLRQNGGLSGFPKREESPHDSFNTGHSSTSISAALGMALARDRKGERYEVVAVIGDGAIGAGMAFEAMNHAGHLKTHLIVLLNDNELSISGSVGALAGYLSRVRTSTPYTRGKERVQRLLRSWHPGGAKVLKVVGRLKESVKYLLLPGMVFEELGFTYLGPADGHDISMLTEVLNRARRTKGPVLVHILTKKGRGYEPAEKNPDLFHGIGPFDVKTGKPSDKSPLPTYTAVFGRNLIRLAERDDCLVAITAAMSTGTGLSTFAREFPHRFYDVGIAEQHAVTLAAGMAAAGLRPVVAIYSTFLQRAYDQVVHDVCLQNLPVVFAIDRAGLVGEDGETHQGLFDLSYLRHIPNITVMAPRDEDQLQRLLVTAVSINGPSALRYPRGKGIGVPLSEDPQPVPVGQAELLQEGKDLAILAVGPLVYAALAAARSLAGYGIKAAVVDARFIKPLDNDLILRLAAETGHLLTLEEQTICGGFGAAVLELLSSQGMRNVSVRRLGIPDTFVTHGKPDELRARYGLNAQGIARAAAELVKKPLARAKIQ